MAEGNGGEDPNHDFLHKVRILEVTNCRLQEKETQKKHMYISRNSSFVKLGEGGGGGSQIIHPKCGI